MYPKVTEHLKIVLLNGGPITEIVTCLRVELEVVRRGGPTTTKRNGVTCLRTEVELKVAPSDDLARTQSPRGVCGDLKVQEGRGLRAVSPLTVPQMK